MLHRPICLATRLTQSLRSDSRPLYGLLLRRLSAVATTSASKPAANALSPAKWAEQNRYNSKEEGTIHPLEANTLVTGSQEVSAQIGLLGAESVDFAMLGVSPAIAVALRDVFGATVPSESQRAFLPSALSHSDVYLKDETGSGKSLAIITAVLSKQLLPLYTPQPGSDESAKLHEKRYLTTLIMVPTRELAVQLTCWIRDLSPHVRPADHSKLVQCLINGVDEEVQFNLLKATTPRIIVGTPVRLAALHQRRAFDASRLQTLVLDEVDRLVNATDRYETVSQKFKSHVHPLAGEVFLDRLFKERAAAMKAAATPMIRPHNKWGAKGPARPKRGVDRRANMDPAAKRMQVIACSATLNNPLRRQLTKFKGYMKEPVLLDMKGTTRSPDSLIHRCLVFDSLGNTRNLEQPDVPLASLAASTHFAQPKSSPAPKSQSPEGSGLRHTKSSQAPLEHPSDSSFLPALADSADEIIETVAKICHAEKVERALVFVHSSVSQSDLVDRLTALGLKAAKLMNFVDYEGQTVRGGDSTVAAPTAEVGNSDADLGEVSPTQTGEVRHENDVLDAEPTAESPDTASSSKLPRPFAAFQSGRRNVIVLNEYEARGLDLPTVSHVFILGPPSSPASYVHMAGRAGRYGKEGHAITMIGGDRYEKRLLGLYHLLRIKLV
ncbi:hypothetical protein HDU87_007104 [Geranomyces variabilis]|uniref:RNA helicase n=1 Tax=Geranomyces variabilis TaxID=109894 RepID=A0AAD5TF44_9FUNG|nr:hypothetical protein HDU87_007104 [Geranomyces variabilis]